jgi:CheY-like chemotaxis protein
MYLPRGQDIDLVLLDMTMPVMGGEALERRRSARGRDSLA